MTGRTIVRAEKLHDGGDFGQKPDAELLEDLVEEGGK